MKIIKLQTLPIPTAYYPCLHDYCAEEASYPPDRLFWVDDSETKGWLCENCWDERIWQEGEISTKRISLEDEIARQSRLANLTNA